MSAGEDAENKRMKSAFLCAAYLVCSLSGAAGQESFAQRMEALLAKERISAEEAAWFALIGARLIGEETFETAAFFIAQKERWLAPGLRHNDALRCKDAAQLIAGAFRIRGSLWYALTKTGRTAFHLLQEKKMMSAKDDPLLEISGEAFLYCLQKARDS
jgi:hypothetical protein